MSAPHGRTLFVWQEAPYDAWSEGWDAVCVKVMDGKATSSAGVFDWAGNAQAWKNAAGGHQVGVWLWLYPSDGAEIGATLASVAPWAEYVVLDVEDPTGGTWTADGLATVVDSIRSHLRGVPVGYSTYPTASQAHDHSVDVAVLHGVCDFSVPQVYYPYQRAALEQVYADNIGPVLAVAPDDDAGWLAAATESVHRTSAVFVWRAGMADTRSWAPQIPQPAPPVPVVAPDPALQPTSWATDPWPAVSVVWDGSGWWVTDLIWRRPASEDMVRGLVASGWTVRWWPDVVSQTGLVKVG